MCIRDSIYITSQKELNLCRVIFATAQSMLKVVDGGEFDVTKRTVAATKLAEGDCVVNVAALTDQRNIVLQTRGGFFLRFSIDEIPEKKKGAIGVRGMKLADKDVVENVYYLSLIHIYIASEDLKLRGPGDIFGIRPVSYTHLLWCRCRSWQ